METSSGAAQKRKRPGSGASAVRQQPETATELVPNAFVRIGTDGAVTVLSKHIEFGQGSYSGLATIVACGEDVAPQEEQLRPVRYFMVDADSGTRLRSFSGLSKSSTESRISFKVPGTVTDVPVQIGQRLEAGDVIAELDRATYDLQAQQAQASLVQAQAAARSAESAYSTMYCSAPTRASSSVSAT